MQYSPKLKKVMEEIKSLLEENDVAGHVVLHTPGHAEYLMHLTPSYSCLTIDEATGRVRFKSRLQEDHGGDVELQRKTLEGTANMLSSMTNVMGNNSLMIMKLSEIADHTFNTKHSPGQSSSSQQQNN